MTLLILTKESNINSNDIILTIFSKLFSLIWFGPGVWITGNDEVICGYTAKIKAKVKRSSPSCLAIAWQKRRGNLVEIIDTTQQKSHTNGRMTNSKLAK